MLVYLIVTLIITVILCAVLLKGTMLIMGRIAGKYVGETHRDIEYITTTRHVPEVWISSFRKKLAKQPTLSPDSPQLQRIKSETKATCLKKLRKLLKYSENSSIIQDEATRQVLLKDLNAIYDEWIEQDLDAMIAHG